MACDDRGRVVIAVTPEILNRGCCVDPANVPPGLKRGELNAEGKRWQLWSIGIKGASADTLIEQLYGG